MKQSRKEDDEEKVQLKQSGTARNEKQSRTSRGGQTKDWMLGNPRAKFP
jgi:hypothetical protein